MKVMITGASGFLGKALVKEFEGNTDHTLVELSSKDGNLVNRVSVDNLIDFYNPDVIVHLAANVGGIGANMAKPAEFFYNNIMMGVNLIDSAYRHRVKKFIQIGTVCAYPKFTPIPFKESDLWNGYPEETNAPYGLAKKSLLVMLQAYRQQYGFNGIYLLPVNLYGPHDNFDPTASHVIPALINKVAIAKYKGHDILPVWGTGAASREFLYVDDCARGIRLATEKYDGAEPVNLGSGHEIKMASLVTKIKGLMGWEGTINWDHSKPDGQPRRCLDTRRAKELFDFSAQVDLNEGLHRTVQWFYKEKFDADAVA